MIRTFLATLCLAAAQWLMRPRAAPRVVPISKAETGPAAEVFRREVTLYRLRIADGYLGMALGWKANEVRQ